VRAKLDELPSNGLLRIYTHSVIVTRFSLAPGQYSYSIRGLLAALLNVHRVPANRPILAFVQPVDLCHILVRELKAKHVCIVFNAARIRRLGERHEAANETLTFT